MDQEITRVLFLCTGNSCRSQMAEGFLRHFAIPAVEAYSAGLKPAEIHPLTRQVMAEAGVDISGQYSKPVSEYLGKVHFHYLITVCADADQNCPTVWPGLGARLHWGFDDPARVEGDEPTRLAVFRTVRDQIRLKTIKWVRDHDWLK